MADGQPPSSGSDGPFPLVGTILFLGGLASGIAAFAIPESYGDAVRNGLGGVAAAIVSAGSLLAFAIARRR